MKRKIFNIFLVLMSMLTIFLFSSENATSSTKTSKSVAKEVISVVIKDKKKVDKIVDKDFKVIRKMAHLTEYFLLGFLLINVWADGKKDITVKYIVVAVLIAALYAGSDEYHQTLVAGRAGQIVDVGIDTFGAMLGSIFYYMLFKIYKNKNKKLNKT